MSDSDFGSLTIAAWLLAARGWLALLAGLVAGLAVLPLAPFAPTLFAATLFAPTPFADALAHDVHAALHALAQLHLRAALLPTCALSGSRVEAAAPLGPTPLTLRPGLLTLRTTLPGLRRLAAAATPLFTLAAWSAFAALALTLLPALLQSFAQLAEAFLHLLQALLQELAGLAFAARRALTFLRCRGGDERENEAENEQQVFH